MGGQAWPRQLADGHLLTYDGDGHTAYREGSHCVDTVVDAYLLKGTVPPDRQDLLSPAGCSTRRDPLRP